MELKGKTAVVTGAGRGIGRCIAERLAVEGCRVALVARTQSQLAEVAASIQSKGGEALRIAADLGLVSETKRIMEIVRNMYGNVHILVNNAAILKPTPFMEIEEEEWDSTYAVNVKAPLFLGQEAIRMMSTNGGGYIINIASTAALDVPAGLASYGSSKMALTAISQAMYQVGKEHDVKVSVIHPGMTDTEMLRSFDPPVESEKWMKPEDISDLVVYLLTQSKRIVIREITPWAARHDKI